MNFRIAPAWLQEGTRRTLMWSLRSPWPDPSSWSQDEALTPTSSLEYSSRGRAPSACRSNRDCSTGAQADGPQDAILKNGVAHAKASRCEPVLTLLSLPNIIHNHVSDLLH